MRKWWVRIESGYTASQGKNSKYFKGNSMKRQHAIPARIGSGVVVLLLTVAFAGAVYAEGGQVIEEIVVTFVI